MGEWTIERLDKSHARESFRCGNDSLDTFLHSLAGQYERRRLGRTFVATPPGEKRVVGYYTAAAGSVGLSCLPEAARKRLPRHPVPTAHLARLVVDLSCRGKRLGETLLFHFLRQALEASESFGVFAVDVLATDEQAGAFYRKYGFITLDDDPLHLFLPLQTVQAMLAP
jgi:ribosomal protein S18 acetylase RimI-like enzyme